MTETIQVKAEPLTKLSCLDDVFFKIERPSQLMTISGMWIFEECPEQSSIEAELVRWVQEFPVFKCKLDGKKWVEDKDYKLENHLEIFTLDPENSGKRGIEKYVSEKMSIPFDMNKPLWSAHLIKGLHGGKGGAFLVKLHHCISDGQGTIRMVLSLASSSKEEAISGAGHTMSENKKFKKNGNSPNSSSSELDKPTINSLKPIQKIISKNSSLGLFPLLSAIITWFLTLLMIISDSFISNIILLLKLAYKWLVILFVPKKVYNKPSGVQKEIVYSELLDLEEVKQVGKLTGATLNDVLIAVLTSSIRKHLISTNQLSLQKDISCVVPVSVRKPDDWRLGNKVCILPLLLPTHIEDPVERLLEVKKRLDDMKNSLEIPISAFSSLYGLAFVPQFIQQTLADFFKYRYHILLTNVPGPKNQISYAGKPVKEYISFVPQPSQGGLGMCVLSYNGKVSVSLNCDVGHIQPSASSITDYFVEEFNNLRDSLLSAENKKDK